MADTRYSLYVAEIRASEHKRLEAREIPDPFHTTFIYPRGVLTALRVLFGRIGFQVQVSANPETVERVMELSPDYLGPPGSPSRLRWQAELEGALHRFAEKLPEEA